ncbi:adenosylcobinamide-GDP ribazoletransferase [Thiomicrorhabdus cannonii]|uniref:adenosylcobinamide-GDP ribazoletransferase n=1 Tax=Thiomicrorhabdus cannonii TaxID=2748011 RepID=UPI0015BE8E6E|nr:adenosylcobinamide-GDP ribazoletransferase [Thiomicrorhabdus cannonii]
MKSFWLAWQFLTRLPAPSYAEVSAKESGASLAYYPLVGLVIGLMLWGLAQLALWLPANLVAGLVLAFWVWVSGGLHLDGLADSSDAWLGAHGDKTRALNIMHDSRIGSGGAIAIALLLLLKWIALTELLSADLSWVLLLVPFWGRLSAQALLLTTPYVSGGIARDMILHLPKKRMWVWVLLGVAGILWTTQFWGLSLLLSWWVVRVWAFKLLGGLNGDLLGASIEITELVVMIAFVGFYFNF